MIFLCKAEALDLDKTVIQTVEEVAEDWRIDDIKGLLGRCNFKADMLDRKVSLLSGGEKVKSTGPSISYLYVQLHTLRNSGFKINEFVSFLNRLLKLSFIYTLLDLFVAYVKVD